jgi:hypothetical protein
MITILTRPPTLSILTAKEIGAEILGRKRGPRAVLDSLKRGLTNIDEPYAINSLRVTPITHVVSGAATLKYAIKKKQEGKIQQLIAGPVISVLPTDHDSIILSPEIDLILFPSKWTKDFFVSQAPILADKIKIWPAGTTVSEDVSSRSHKRVLFFIKNPDDIAEKRTAKVFTEAGYQVVRMVYGKFSQKEYFTNLLTCSAMVYMSFSESQGLALQEAWMRDVPTFVYNRGFWQAGTDTWKDSRISAPYLDARAGTFFSPDGNIEMEARSFIENIASFSPRVRALELSDEACAKKYIDIINAHEA